MLGTTAVWREDVAEEVEALQATYADDLQCDEASQQLSMLLLPPLEDDSQQHFVQCMVQLTVGPAYPAAAPKIALQDVRGFQAREQQLTNHLADEAAQMEGEMVLGLLFEAAKAWLAEHDWPEGPCIFCLEDLATHSQQHCSTTSTSTSSAAVAAAATTSSSGSASQPAAAAEQAACQQPVLRLPCLHAFHRTCFAGWWCWQQEALQQQQAALEAKTGATAAASLVQEQLPPREGAHFRLNCPSCRAPFSMLDLQQDMQQLLLSQLKQQQQQQQQEGAWRNTQQQQQEQLLQKPACAAKLTAAQLEPFRELQRRHAALFVKQQQRHGIIATDSSYCIADWEGPGAGGAGSTGVDQAGGYSCTPGPNGSNGSGGSNSSSSGTSFAGGRTGRGGREGGSLMQGQRGTGSRGARSRGSRDARGPAGSQGAEQPTGQPCSSAQHGRRESHHSRGARGHSRGRGSRRGGHTQQA